MTVRGPFIPGGISCRELVELVTEYLDDALPRDEHARMGKHLELCGACVAHVDQVRATAHLAAVATVELELRPDRDALLLGFREFSQNR